MKLTSNIREVMDRVSSIPAAAQRSAEGAISPAYWLPRFQVAAEKTLRAMWATERNVAKRELYERMTPQIMQAIEATLNGLVATYTLKLNKLTGGEEMPTLLQQAQSDNLAGRLRTGDVSKNYRQPVQSITEQNQRLEWVRDKIYEWVALQKRKETEPGGRDAGLTDQEIAERIEWILGLHNASSPSRTAAMEEAAKGLAAEVQRYIDEDAPDNPPASSLDSVRIDEATAREWLDAILASWMQRVLGGLAERWQLLFRKEYGKRIQKSLI